MPIDEKTQHLKLPLPHQENRLEDDLPRLRQALAQLDAGAVAQDAVVSGLAQRAVTLEARTQGLVLAQGKTAAELEAHQAADNPHHRPLATRERAGLVQVGEGLKVDDSGLISACGVLPGAVPAFSGAFGGPGDRHPIPHGCSEPDMGWALCDGGSDGRGGSTPGLRGRMILGADAARPSGTVGDSENHAHSLSGAVGETTLSVEQLAAHMHTVDLRDTGWGNGNLVDARSGNRNDAYKGALPTASAGSSTPHAHSLAGSSVMASSLPPYYALAYIMRLLPPECMSRASA